MIVTVVTLWFLRFEGGSGLGLAMAISAPAVVLLAAAALAAVQIAAAAAALDLGFILVVLCLSVLTLAGPVRSMVPSRLLLFPPDSLKPCPRSPSPIVRHLYGDLPMSAPYPPSTCTCQATTSLPTSHEYLAILPSCRQFVATVPLRTPAASFFSPFGFSYLPNYLMTSRYILAFSRSYTAPTTHSPP